MSAVLLLACLAFCISTIWSVVKNAWPMAFLAEGLFLMALHASGLIT